jgi:hydroxymethylpyrimidine pyrophosphatase-like HAD family hydrolase
MTDQPMVFFVKGTHGTTYDNWLFPIPPEDFNNDSVMQILKGIASDLDKDLREKARKLIKDNCMHSDKDSESSGHSSAMPEDGGSRKAVQAFQKYRNKVEQVG